MEIIIFLQALLLGIVEGITEFLPISSTGHLILLVDILGFNAVEGKVFEVVIQLGAILAICWYYRSKLLHIVFNFHRDAGDRKFIYLLLIAFAPAAIIGVFAHGYIKAVLFSPFVVAVMLIIGGILIIIIEKFKPSPTTNNIDKITIKQALIIGVFQTIAMIPGTSRSGATIMGAMLIGISRKTAAEFSFFLAIPTMFGAAVYDIYKNHEILTTDGVGIIAVGFVAAFIAGLLTVGWLLKFLETHGFVPFAIYRIIIGSVILILLYV